MISLLDTFFMYTVFLMTHLSYVCSKNVSIQRNVKAEAAPWRHVSLGVPVAVAAELWILSKLHTMGRPRAWHLQADQLKGRLTFVGNSQEQARYELRDDGPCFEVVLCFILFCCVLKPSSLQRLAALWVFVSMCPLSLLLFIFISRFQQVHSMTSFV